MNQESFMKRLWFAFCLGSGVLALALARPAAAEDPQPKSPVDKEISFVVPQGSPEQVAEFIQDLQKKVNRKMFDLRNNLRRASLEAADAILAGHPGAKEGEVAVNLKMQYLRSLQDLQELAEELKESGHENLVRLVTGRIWQIRLSLASRGSPSALKKTLQDALNYLGKGPVENADVRLGQVISQLAEATGDKDYTLDVYRKLGALFDKSTEEDAAAFGRKMAGVVRRLTLLGKPIELEGTLLNGKPLDMAKYKNKVVLVDFWATWCGPCLEEIPNLKRNYKRYHDKGFEIISLSLDRTKAPVEKFVKEEDIPWANVYGAEGPSPSVEYYGVLFIPTMILVDRDGKVVSITARREELDRLLEKYLGSEEKHKTPEEN
jgi:thiol-disulfide isomerase/thioredoxin